MSRGFKVIPTATQVMIDEFMERVDQRVCWLWTGPWNDVTGHGTHKGFVAHRVAYEWLVGPIPTGHQVVHLCRVRECVRPEHLEAMTPQENGRRAWMATLPWRGRIQRMEKVPCTCWDAPDHACEREGHTRLRPYFRVRRGGLRPGDRTPIRRVQMVTLTMRCPQCGKVIAEGDRTGCDWCGLVLVVDGTHFVVASAPIIGARGEIEILGSRNP